MRNKMRLLTPGPTPLPEEVRLALARDMEHHRKPPFKKLLNECQTGLRLLFGTAQPVLPLTCSGTGAMYAAVSACFAPGETVLVVEGGKFGERFLEICQARGINVVTLSVPWGQAADPQAVLDAATGCPEASGLLVQASETSTGVLHPVRELARVAHERNLLLMVDGISAVGISPCPMDDWGIDCLLTGSQKGLMLPPGLAFVALSPKAWAKAEQVRSPEFYFNLLAERDKCAGGQTLFTPAINLLVALREALRLFQAEGLDSVFCKQWALTCLTRTAIAAMGLEPLARTHFTWGLTSIRLPAGIDGQKLLDLAASRYGVIMAGGQGQLKGRIVRLGHMGHVDWADVAAGVRALAQAFQACGGHVGCRDYLEQGLAAYESALETWKADQWPL